MAALKVLVVGDVNGQVSKLYKKVASVQKKSGDFDMLLCTGSFFGVDGSVDETWDKYVKGELTVPIDTYILGPATEAQLPQYARVKRGGDLCDKITYLGQQGVMVMPPGLKLAYLGGGYDPKVHADEDRPEPRVGYSKADVDALVNHAARPSYSGVDVFLTPRWPTGVSARCPFPASDAVASGTIDPGSAAAAAALRPRYHFAGGCMAFYARAPYTNSSGSHDPKNVTRFFGLAAVGNAAKEKWIYAFNCKPLSKMDPAEVVAVPADATPSPYLGATPVPPGHQQHLPPPIPAQAGFFFTAPPAGGPAGDRKRKRPDGGGHPRERPPPRKPSGPCWFCLGGEQVEKHLVTAIGTKVYLALAKGGMVPDHVLILPIECIPSSLALDTDTRAEIAAYQEALRKFFAAQGKACVMWERNMRSKHLQIQVCPIPEDRASSVGDAFRARGQRLAPGFRWEELADGVSHSDVLDADRDPPYFLAFLPDGKQLLHRISSGFPLQFGRETMAVPELLNDPTRVDWKRCSETKESETEHAKQFREAFKPFDPARK